MEHAIELAEGLWAKAYAAEPEFVEQYLRIAEALLLSKPEVAGDEFRERCAESGLRRPKTLHPNVWVSGVLALKRLGWIKQKAKVVPQKAHNHMPSVTLWTSMLFAR
jgi:hypothetical protein